MDLCGGRISFRGLLACFGDQFTASILSMWGLAAVFSFPLFWLAAHRFVGSDFLVVRRVFLISVFFAALVWWAHAMWFNPIVFEGEQPSCYALSFVLGANLIDPVLLVSLSGLSVILMSWFEKRKVH